MQIILANPRGFCAGSTWRSNASNARSTSSGRRCMSITRSCTTSSLSKNSGTAAPCSSSRSMKSRQAPPCSTAPTASHPRFASRHAGGRLIAIDATCPLVIKVHLEAIRYAHEGYTIFLIGHEGHDEVIGTMGEAPNQIILVETAEDVDKLVVANPDKVAYLTQTTLSVDDANIVIAALRKKFPSIANPPKDDICYATQNRQEAVRELAAQADLVLVLGSQNSSNSRRLAEIARGSAFRRT